MSIKPFLDHNFLLQNKTAELLYHEYAAHLPIIDYHNHLSPEEIANDKIFKNITSIWLQGDHYKWRAMRTLGVSERYITGDATAREKFEKWAFTVPYTQRNPLYHWTHLELRRYFDIQSLLDADTAVHVYNTTGELLQTPQYSTQNLLRKMNVAVVCTTDDPIDDLRYHRQFRETGSDLKMSMAFRPDKAILIANSHFLSYIKSLSQVVDFEINSFSHLQQALSQRIDFFHDNGCRLSDHGLEQIYYTDFTDAEVNKIFQKRLTGIEVTVLEAQKYASAVLYHLGTSYAQKGWVQQFHLGALRNNNNRMLRELGPDTGFDSIGDFEQAVPLARLLNHLDDQNQLAKTILYNLNPRDNEVMASMIGNYNDGSIKGKMQYGSAWWFLDQKDGMEKQLNAISNMGLLSCFIGMLTDSRSFLSFPRHEYFRRILCNMIGKDVHNGELPDDTKWLGTLVSDICYHNAKNYFNF